MANFPAKERELFEPLGIQAILIIPIMIENEFVGVIGFDNCVLAREWDDVEQTFLQTAAHDLAQAIRRVRSEEQVRTSLAEKEILLREIHHRVKNNMQVIVSLLKMYSRRIDDARLGKVFDDCRNRVSAMSLVHETLYQSDDLSRINFESYLKKLCHSLRRAHGASGATISLAIESHSVMLDMDQSVAIGMVISELVANAFKHAFTDGHEGKLLISLSGSDDGTVELIVQDNGKGLPPDVDIFHSRSLGLQLVSATVTRELDGSIEVKQDGGTRFIIRFQGNGEAKV